MGALVGFIEKAKIDMSAYSIIFLFPLFYAEVISRICFLLHLLVPIPPATYWVQETYF